MSVDCLSVAFAILVIDRLNERRAEEALKAQLIREMGSSDNVTVLHAVEELRGRGWLKDGTLCKSFLVGANLQGADLSWANLQGADLNNTNLQNVRLYNAILQGATLENADMLGVRGLTTHQLLATRYLSGANMPDILTAPGKAIEMHVYKYARKIGGHIEQHFINGVERDIPILKLNGLRYDGRFRLHPEHEQLRKPGFNKDFEVTAEFIAELYDIPLEEYLAGQEWAREHLADLRREAGLDPDTGLPVEPANGVEQQPADAPALPAPRRNGHKASMVSHRVRR